MIFHLKVIQTQTNWNLPFLEFLFQTSSTVFTSQLKLEEI